MKTRYLALLLVFSSCQAQHASETTSVTNEANIEDTPTASTDIEGVENYPPISQFVRRIFEDSRENLWMGTNGDGAARYANGQLDFFYIDQDFAGVAVRAIFEDQAGLVWFATEHGICRWDGNSFKTFRDEEGLGETDCWSMIQDHEGGFWVGTMDGIYRFNGSNFTPFPLPKITVDGAEAMLSATRISTITEDNSGQLWFGIDGHGVVRYNPMAKEESKKDAFEHYSEQTGLHGNNITSILEDAQGKIWMGSMYQGVCRYDRKADGRLDTSSKEAFTATGQIEGIEVWSLFEDSRGHIWFPAENHGVYCYNGTTFENFMEEDGLTTNAIQCIHEDAKGRIWMGGYTGLYRYNPADALSQDGRVIIPVSAEGPWE